MATNKGILAVALPQQGKISPATYELLTVGRQLADTLKEPLAAVLVGGKADQAQELVDRGADKVYVIDHASLAQFTDELHTRAVGELCEKEGFGKILISASVSGRALAARLSVRLKAGCSAEVAAITGDAEKGLKVSRSHYGGNIISDIEFKTPVQIVTVVPMAFGQAEKQSGRTGETVNVAFDPAAKPSRTEFVSFQAEETNEIELGSADKIVAGGRGLGNTDGFKVIRELAQTLGAAVGASRAAVDSGWIPYKNQVGLTGRSVRPKLYVACGISGQIQHLAGMSSSGTIVAINTDDECPMMELASLAVKADLFEIIPQIVEEVKKRKGQAVAA